MNYILSVLFWLARLFHRHRWRYSGTGEQTTRWCPCSALQVAVWEKVSKYPIHFYVLRGYRDISDIQE